MLPVDASFTPWVLRSVLVVLLVLLGWRAGAKDRHEYQEFKKLEHTHQRQRVMHKWLLEALFWFGGSSLIVLVLAWGFISRMLEQVESWPLMASFRGLLAESGLASGLIIGGAIGLLLGLLALVFFGRNEKDVPTIGDIHALLPRNRAELKYGALMSINAGVVEEVLFRLALPVLVFGAFGNAFLAIVVSLIVFGMLHAYQGAAGIIGSFLLGVVLMAVFLATGNIVWPIIVHAVFDLRSLVLIPVVVYQVHLPVSARRVKAFESDVEEITKDGPTRDADA